MAWNPFSKIKEKLTGKAPEAPEQAAPAELKDLKDLEKQGMLGKFFRHWKNPAFLSQMKALAARMQADGVNLRDRKAVQAWMEKHKDDIAGGRIEAAPAEKPQTYVKTAPETGRNDPCPCGSGKKFKKCCGK